MATLKWCPKHGFYPEGKCPACKPEPSKKSDKYGGKTIIIPPNMRAVK